MTRIDASAFLGRWPFRPIEGTVAKLQAMMRANGLEQAVVSSFEGLFYADPEPANEEILRKISGRKGLWAAPTLNLRIADWREQAKVLAGNPQVRAVLVAPTFHGYEVSACEEAARVAASHELVLIVQVRLEDERHLSPVLELPAASVKEIVSVAASVPKARIVVSAARLTEVLEVGGAGPRPALKNLWFGMSHFDGLDCIRRACQAVGAKRLLLSTSWPFFYAKSGVLKVEEAEVAVPSRGAVFGANARRAFALR
jgi:hypothetical protein